MKDKESNTLESSEESRPFFARFLEGQESSNASFRTLKYPSDRDEMDQRLEYTPANSGPQQ